MSHKSHPSTGDLIQERGASSLYSEEKEIMLFARPALCVCARLIEVEDTFTIPGLNCDPGIIRNEPSANPSTALFTGVEQCFKKPHNEWVGFKS